MTEIISAAASLDEITAQIKLKLVENRVLANAFNRNINQNSVEIGQWLTQAKKLVNYGQWQNWLADNFQMTVRTAQNYMKVAAYFGVNSTLKSENVFFFQPAALIELTKMTPAELPKFLAETPNADKLSVRNLREQIKQWKKPAPVTVDAEIKTAPADEKPLKLPPPQFVKIPALLVDAAKAAGVEIAMNFSRTLRPTDTEILLTRLNGSAIKEYSAVADCVIFAAPLEFTRSDNAVKKLRPAIWYFGGVAQFFFQHFGLFGNLFLPAKKPAKTGNVDKPINNCGEIITFKGDKFNGTLYQR